MKVRELVEKLAELDQELEVVVSSDGEGNNFSPLDKDFGITHYEPDSTYSGKIGYLELNETLIELGYIEEDLLDKNNAVPCVVLYPIN
jgi:hypothetical protein